jgi:uncharacterized membrane protein (DUF2068 family)
MPSPTDAPRADERQRVGFRLIIGYKFCKAVFMFGVALWLTIAPGSAFRTLEWLARELAEGGAAFARASHWIRAHLTSGFVLRGALLAWLDSASSALEGFLLLTGKPWAEWVVIVGLACLLPFEILAVMHRPDLARFLVLLANIAIVAYLARQRIRKGHTSHPV